ncbi:MAG: phosphoribosylanthranilate isomerase [Vallitalea sp.]|jgi:phosphoribosylanthranilate isomerase|nr:phosphoribosylanthranilate isomerase [Vallitalea sp.]
MHIQTKVKICGITTKKEISLINKYDIDYIGFVFAQSKRQVTVEQVIQLRKSLREYIKTVGVFVNHPIKEVNDIARKCGLDVCQLHGEEKQWECLEVNTEVWKSISIKDEKSIIELDKFKKVNALVLDTYVKGEKGGTGKNFNWELAKGLSTKYKIALAGGLNPTNVEDAIEIVRPQIIDVSSGVETNGKKDESKIKTFVRRVKRYGFS